MDEQAKEGRRSRWVKKEEEEEKREETVACSRKIKEENRKNQLGE